MQKKAGLSLAVGLGIVALLFSGCSGQPRVDNTATGGSSNSTGGGIGFDADSPPATCTSGVPVKAIVASGHHTCVLTVAGGVRCWGANYSGELHYGLPTSTDVMPDVDALTGVQAIALGDTHTCAVTDSGGVRCWGRNVNGELGDGTTVSTTAPPTTDVLTNAKAVAIGSNHTCAVTQTGGVRCWGANSTEQLGDGTTAARLTPPENDVLTGAVDVAAADTFTCALMESGNVRCWGGQYNCITPFSSRLCGEYIYGYGLPTIDVLTNQKAITSDGNSIYSLSLSGGVVTALYEDTSSSPVYFGAEPKVLSGGCIITDAGGVRCGGSTDEANAPTKDLLTNAIAVAQGRATCAVTTSGGVYCWGDDSFGQLGNGPPAVFDVPPQNDVLTDVQAISISAYHTCAVTTAGGLRCWGNNDFGQLGDGSTIDRSVPPFTDILTDVQSVATGSVHTCALTKAGGVRCWGSAALLGHADFVYDENNLRPPAEDVLTDVLAIAASDSYTCALTNAGGVRCWGHLSSITKSIVDSRAPSGDLLTGATAIDVGPLNACAIMATGGLRCWGDNQSGQLANGSTLDTSLEDALQAEILPNVQSASVGYGHACAVTPASRIQCWGGNGSGQLGDSTPYGNVAVTPSAEFFSDVQSLATGGSHTCALTTAGGVRCWGYNGFGQLGDGTTQSTSSVPEADVIGGVKAIAAAGAQTCVLTTAGGVRCWGDNYYGQLGNGAPTVTALWSDVPVHVIGTCD